MIYFIIGVAVGVAFALIVTMSASLIGYRLVSKAVLERFWNSGYIHKIHSNQSGIFRTLYKHLNKFGIND